VHYASSLAFDSYCYNADALIETHITASRFQSNYCLEDSSWLLHYSAINPLDE
jgi:hypothetical protein